MRDAEDLACFALTASAYEALDAASSIDAVQDILERARAAGVYARYAKNAELEADADKIRLYGELRLYELTVQQAEAS